MTSIVEKARLEELRAAKESVIIAVAIANEKDATFKSLVAQTLQSLGQPIEHSVICLTCGEVRRLRTDHKCPDEPADEAGKSEGPSVG